MDRDQPPSARAQDVGLREARTIARARHFAEREEGGERLDGEMRHRLEHRDFDEPALPVRPRSKQRAEHAVGGIDAGDRIRQRRPQEARPFRIDHDAEKPAQRLRHGVVARPIDVRTARAETADRAVDQPRIELLQAARTPAPSRSAVPGRKFWM